MKETKKNPMIIMATGNKGSLGVPVIDELRLCYYAGPSVLEGISTVPVGRTWYSPPFTLFRQMGDRYEFTYIVCLGDYGEREEVGELRFCRFGDRDRQHAYYRIYNRVLYDPEKLHLTLSLPARLGLIFNNYTRVDIAMDFPKDITKIIRRMIRNPQVTTIINGKVVKDRDEDIEAHFDYSSTLNRLKNPTFNLCQAKAERVKNRGIVIQSYNKKAEIVKSSGKEYILAHYNHPRFLFRLEVRIPYQELKDYCRKVGVVQSVDILFDRDFLAGLFYYHLSAVLRFRKGRKVLRWEDIINCTGRV